LVGELLENGGFLPQLAELRKGQSSWFTRKNGIIFSILWFIFFVMMMPAFFGIADAEAPAAISAVFGVFTTMMLVVTSLAFLKRAPKAYELAAHQMPTSTPAAMYGNQPMGALPPQQSQPASSYMPPEGSWRAPDTGDLVKPGSVTEGTTRLLKKDE